jgi:transcriptional regulator with XRE-family HTH domain
MVINAAALAAIRERTGLTQLALAEASGVSQGRISELEKANLNVRPETVKVLAEALQVPTVAITAAA